MKRNQLHSAGRLARHSCLPLAIALAFWAGVPPKLSAQAVPDRINYQGILLRGDGTPVPAASTDVEFRIYDTPTLATGLQWGRMFQITPDTNGAFNVVLSSEGAPLSEAPEVSLASVFTGIGSDARYLELTVYGSTPIRPRQRFVAAPYAFLAHDVTEARRNFSVAGILTVSGPANLANLNATGKVTVGALDAATAITGNSLTVNNDATIKGQLSATADVSIQGQLQVNSDAGVEGRLSVTGDTTLKGKLTLTNGNVNMVSRAGYSAALVERTNYVNNSTWQSVLTSRSFTTDGFIVVYLENYYAQLVRGWNYDRNCRITIDGKVFESRNARGVYGGDSDHNEVTTTHDTFSLPLPKGASVAVDAWVGGSGGSGYLKASIFFVPFGSQ